MRRLMNYLRGMAVVRLTGLFPERLINLCAQEGIEFWAMEWLDEHTVRLTTRRYTLKRLEELARRAGMSEVYLHQVFSGRRKPSRDRMLCLCIGMGASLEETQQLLKQVGYAPIYLRLKRDAIIGHGLLHHTPLTEINDKLFSENEKTLI